MFSGKTVVIGVTGSIAAYKIATLTSMLKKANANVHVIMTENAKNFINPITFETLTGNKCITDTFDRNFEYNVEHISLAKSADVFLVAPASANVIGKMASGIADDMLTTTILACKCKKIVAPAMNTRMFENEIVSDNIEKLKKYGFEIVSPDEGYLACGDVGKGKMVSPEVLFDYISREIACKKDMLGKRVLITAGATMEAIDPVRYITNHSTGKMGIALAKNAMLRGAKVTLVCAQTSEVVPPFVDVVRVQSAKDMMEAVKAHYEDCDIIVKAAAVADYTPENVCSEKIKKSEGDLSISLKRTDDILSYIGNNRKDGQFICGFSMETENMLENSKAKLIKKNVDMIVANNLRTDGAGFGTDTNVVTIITKSETVELLKMSKDKVAEKIFDKIMDLL